MLPLVKHPAAKRRNFALDAVSSLLNLELGVIPASKAKKKKIVRKKNLDFFKTKTLTCKYITFLTLQTLQAHISFT